MSQVVNPHRHKKKCTSYGVRNTEITRGKNGFGFTISGQSPCIFSCILSGSPAERAGLRPGDFLIAVNGHNVSKARHDDVVRLIGNYTGVLKLQIAESYYSDSSEEEHASAVKSRPKHTHKARNHQLQNSISRAEKVVQDLQTGALFVDHTHVSSETPEKKTQKETNTHVDAVGSRSSNQALFDLILQQVHNYGNKNSLNINNAHTSKSLRQLDSNGKGDKLGETKLDEQFHTLLGARRELFHSIFTEHSLSSILYPLKCASEGQCGNSAKASEGAILKAVVGYLGTIEMPKELQLHNSRLQSIRNCIRRLRVEKKVHTLVLMAIFSDRILLVNSQGLTLAAFDAQKIAFSGVYSDDKKFFGLVTSHEIDSDEQNEGHLKTPFFSSSCHVFMVNSDLTLHHQHVERAKAFHIVCTSNPVTKKCKEFPESADAILQAIVSLYRNRIGFNFEVENEVELLATRSPQPSNTSSNSSNSDSGIGFRDEGTAGSNLFVSGVDSYCRYQSSLDRKAIPQQRFGRNGVISPYSIPQDSFYISCENFSQNHSCGDENNGFKSPNFLNDRLTVRAMPDPIGLNKKENSDMLVNSGSTKESVQKDQHDKKYSISDEQCFQSLNSATGNGECNSAIFINEECKSENSSSLQLKTVEVKPEIFDFDVPLNMPHNDITLDCFDLVCCPCSAQGVANGRTHSRNCSVMGHDENGNGGVQEEGSESGNSGVESVSDIDFPCGSSCSSLLVLNSMHNDVTQKCMPEGGVSVGRVANWAAGFNLLLDDPAGLCAFSEFLKLEFSQENIRFWVACERYRQLTDQHEMAEAAKEIFFKHLCIGADEPVNIDSHARQVAEEGLEFPSPFIFLPAQKQIFNLMKFDCFQRFLKSSIFKECMLCEIQGKPLPYGSDTFLLSDAEKENISKGPVDEKKKRSFIPWHRLTRTKSAHSKNCGRKLASRHCKMQLPLSKGFEVDNHLKADDASSSQSDDGTSSRSSCTGSETEIRVIHSAMFSKEHLDTGGDYCRVILPDCSTTIVKMETGETVGDMLLKLLERRCLHYNAIEAYVSTSQQPLDHGTEVVEQHFNEIRVEQVILFCLELPNKKIVGVKAKGGKTCSEILKPVLHKYGYKMDCMAIVIASSHKLVMQNTPVDMIDNQRIIVYRKDEFVYFADEIQSSFD